MKQESIFNTTSRNAPLAERMRPTTLDEYVGQTHIVSNERILKRMIERDEVQSMILWGPPGVGKTTLAKIIANQTKSKFITFSAVTSSIKDIRTVMNDAAENIQKGIKTIVFVDEIHRFNKAQQDAFLPYVENGSIILIGATTENPSFEINNALLSRCKVFVLNALTTEELVQILSNAITDIRGFGEWDITIDEDCLYMIANYANGDARSALNTLELCVLNGEGEGIHSVITKEIVIQCTGKKFLRYDRNGEEHYNIISALHKSMRNSDVDAAIYWLARMLEAGEDPLYVARRIVRFASEDIGMADSRALSVAIDAYQACHFLGMPECSVHLTHAVTFCALAPKSNALYMAYTEASKDAKEMLDEPVPLHLRNATTKLMQDIGYGEGYVYAHDTEEKLSSMQCMPNNLIGKEYYLPTNQGVEKRVKERKDAITEWKREHKK